MAINKAEDLVLQLCTKSFLSLWSYHAPQGKDRGKELCDILVICDPDVIIFSVKEIKAPDTGDEIVDWQRWRRRAIKESVDQIYGAERFINTSLKVITKEGKDGLLFPDKPVRVIHRVAVALGSEGKFPIELGDFGRGFVHVFDEVSLNAIMQELNTITDFVEYLRTKESLIRTGPKPIMAGEEDLLALYLAKNREFPENTDVLIIDNNFWDEFRASDEYKTKKEADKASYGWNGLIETLCEHIIGGTLEFGNTLSEGEMAIRQMARENRFQRRSLYKAFSEFLLSSTKIHSRMLLSPSGTKYVFLACSTDVLRRHRVAELGARCFVARGLSPDCTTVVGIATEQYVRGQGFSLDICYLHSPNWTPENQAEASRLQEEFGWFVKPEVTHVTEDEYPTSAQG